MARYAILSDIHANLPAVKAVLTHINKQPSGEKVDGIWCLGDLIVYGVNPIEVLRSLRDLKILENCVQGNNDFAISNSLNADSAILQLLGDPELRGRIRDPLVHQRRVAIMTSHDWTWTELDRGAPEMLDILRGLPYTLNRENVLLMHASPCEPVGMEGNYLREAADAEEAFYTQQATVCFFGHTHLPTVFEQTDTDRSFGNVTHLSPIDKQIVALNGNKMLINPGSVGQPRNKDPRAAYAIYDTKGFVEFYRVEYDINAFESILRTKQADILIHVPEDERTLRDQVVDTLADRFRRANW